ncbi:MAG: hypothetical protein FWF46_05860 [Oscillospiraceae bacterium]|nr:hypothetical protein [Oscillospiraceae bacterium]
MSVIDIVENQALFESEEYARWLTDMIDFSIEDVKVTSSKVGVYNDDWLYLYLRFNKPFYRIGGNHICQGSLPTTILFNAQGERKRLEFFLNATGSVSFDEMEGKSMQVVAVEDVVHAFGYPNGEKYVTANGDFKVIPKENLKFYCASTDSLSRNAYFSQYLNQRETDDWRPPLPEKNR